MDRLVKTEPDEDDVERRIGAGDRQLRAPVEHRVLHIAGKGRRPPTSWRWHSLGVKHARHGVLGEFGKRPVDRRTLHDPLSLAATEGGAAERRIRYGHLVLGP